MSTTDKKLPLVWLLGTGGTIAATGAPRLTFYEYGIPGQRLDVHQNLERIPEAQQFVRTKTEHLWHVGSGINTAELLPLAKKINGIFSDDPEVAWVVVTHGPYSTEDTAHCLHPTLHSA